MTIILGYIYCFIALLALILLTFNFSLVNWSMLPKNKNLLLRSEIFWLLITGFVLVNSTPLNWIVGLVMLLHAYNFYLLFFNTDYFYDSVNEAQETIPEYYMDLIGILTFAIIGFIVIYSPSII
jgi:hypothetical protein|tara:strand:+ start:629 stop:1000 length:372 start_codon:yes stop_codon:yes gene_type:complete